MEHKVRLPLLLVIIGIVGCASKQPEPKPSVNHPLDDPAYVAELDGDVSVHAEVPPDQEGLLIISGSCAVSGAMTVEDERYLLAGLKDQARKNALDGIAEVYIRELPNPYGVCAGGTPVGGSAMAFKVPK